MTLAEALSENARLRERLMESAMLLQDGLKYSGAVRRMWMIVRGYGGCSTGIATRVPVSEIIEALKGTG